ncbi:YadA C-terminal domain-containing protein, partial [Dialister micraerophilus]
SEWSQKLGTGKVAKDDGNLVTGKTVYEEFNKRDVNFKKKIDNIQNTVISNVTNAVTENVVNAYGMNIYTGSSMDASTNEFHSEKDWKMKLGELNMAFGGGIQAEQFTDKNGNRYTYVSLEDKSKPGGGTTPSPKPNPNPGGGTTPSPKPNPNPGGGTTPSPKPNSNPGGGTTPSPAPNPNSGGGTNPSKPVDFTGVYNKMNKGFAVMNSKVNRVGAGAAALAALHPLEYDPENKFDFAVGYGNYQGANAVALGAHYRPNENTMLSLGGSFGGGENMINAGMSWRLGQGTSSPLMSKRALAHEIQKLGKVDEIFAEKIKDQDDLISLESITRQREDDKINQRIDELESQVQENNARITELEAIVRNSRR